MKIEVFELGDISTSYIIISLKKLSKYLSPKQYGSQIMLYFDSNLLFDSSIAKDMESLAMGLNTLICLQFGYPTCSFKMNSWN